MSSGCAYMTCSGEPASSGHVSVDSFAADLSSLGAGVCCGAGTGSGEAKCARVKTIALTAPNAKVNANVSTSRRRMISSTDQIEEGRIAEEGRQAIVLLSNCTLSKSVTQRCAASGGQIAGARASWMVRIPADCAASSSATVSDRNRTSPG